MSFSPLIKPLIEVWSSSFVALGVVIDDSLKIFIQPEDKASVQGRVTNAVSYPIVATIQKMRTDKKPATVSSSSKSKPRGLEIFCRVRGEGFLRPCSILPRCATDTPDISES